MEKFIPVCRGDILIFMKWRGHVLLSGGDFLCEIEGACLVKWRGSTYMSSQSTFKRQQYLVLTCFGSRADKLFS